MFVSSMGSCASLLCPWQVLLFLLRLLRGTSRRSQLVSIHGRNPFIHGTIHELRLAELVPHITMQGSCLLPLQPLPLLPAPAWATSYFNMAHGGLSLFKWTPIQFASIIKTFLYHHLLLQKTIHIRAYLRFYYLHQTSRHHKVSTSWFFPVYIKTFLHFHVPLPQLLSIHQISIRIHLYQPVPVKLLSSQLTSASSFLSPTPYQTYLFHVFGTRVHICTYICTCICTYRCTYIFYFFRLKELRPTCIDQTYL